MNIALVHYSAPPVVGGVESVLAHHARLMADAGHTVRVVAGRGDRFDPRIEVLTLPLIDSRHIDVLAAKSVLDSGHVPANFGDLVETVTRELTAALSGVDVVIPHNVCSLNKNLMLTAALNGISQEAGAPRLIVWHHDLAWTTPRYRAELHDGEPWDLLRTAWPGVRQVVVSDLRQTELAELFGLPAEQITVVPNGLDILAFLKIEDQTRSLVQDLSLLEAAPLLLLPVRITRRKNIELAIRAVGELSSQMPDAALVVTGPPGPHNPANAEYFSELKALRKQLGLESAVFFLADMVDSYLPDEVIADFFRLADALLMPSREEGFGIPVLEAGLTGMPIFCSDIQPLRVLGGDDAHYFSPDAEPAAVAAMIAKSLNNDSSYRLRINVRRNYSWRGVYERMIAPLLEKSQ